MPLFDKTPGARVISLVAGFPSYFFGSWGTNNISGTTVKGLGMLTSPSRFLITQVQLTSNVATITGSIIEGEIPQVGALITVRGTQTSAGLFNVTAIAITAVSINASTGIGTISYALVNANIGATADAGLGIVPQVENTETIVNGASIPITIPVQDPKTDAARTISFIIEFPSGLPVAATVDLQTALLNQDSEYTKFSNLVTIAASAISAGTLNPQLTLNQARFYRLNISGVSGGTAWIAKVQA